MCPTSVKNGGAANQTRVLAVNSGSVEASLPETLLIDIWHGDQGLWIELRVVQSSESPPLGCKLYICQED